MKLKKKRLIGNKKKNKRQQRQAQFNASIVEEHEKRKRMRSMAFNINLMNYKSELANNNFFDHEFVYCMNRCCFTQRDKK